MIVPKDAARAAQRRPGVTMFDTRLPARPAGVIEIAGNLISEVESFLRSAAADGKLSERNRDRGAAIYAVRASSD